MDLVDPYGRTVRDLRISVTDRCNFRCTYCMPAEGMKWLPREEILSFEEIERLARLCVERFGVDGIRLTGGEPTVRAHLPVLVEKLSHLRVPSDTRSPYAGRKPDLSITTNGATFRLLAHELRVAGLDRVNVSLDTLDPGRFVEMTRRDELHRVLDGIAAAQEAGFSPVKVNAVVQRGVNDDEIVALAEFGRDHDVQVRFIEFMPLDATGDWQASAVVSQDEIVATIAAVHPLEPVPARGSAPADRWRYLDGRGEVGVIPTVTRAVLRRLRPGPPDRRGPVPHLPLRDPGVRPPGPAQERCDGRRAGRGDHPGGGHEVGRSPDRPGQLHPPDPLDEPDRRLTPRLQGREPGGVTAPPRLRTCPTSGSPTSIRSGGRAWWTSRRRSPPTAGPWPAARCS